jgi:hypothetical protein
MMILQNIYMYFMSIPQEILHIHGLDIEILHHKYINLKMYMQIDDMNVP